MLDVAAFIGTYPHRPVPGSGPEQLLRELDRVGIQHAWVGHLAAAFVADPRPANRDLVRLLGPHRDRLHPAPAVHPGLPDWRQQLAGARRDGAAAVRTYPMHWGLDPSGDAMAALVGAAPLPVILTVRFEDVRQRAPDDTVPDLPAAAVRSLARTAGPAGLIVTAAGRAFVEEVHFGLTPGEAARVLWDISWLWGPPEDELALLVETMGAERFVLGTGIPLRLPEAPLATLDLSHLDADQRAAITDRNATAGAGGDR